VLSSQPPLEPGLFSPAGGITNLGLNPDQPGLSTCVPQRVPGGSGLELPATSDSADTWSPDVFDLEPLDFGQVHHGNFSRRPAADQTMGGNVTAYGLRDLDTMDPYLFEAPSFDWLAGGQSETIDQTTGSSIEAGASSNLRRVTPSNNVVSAVDPEYPDLSYSVLEEM
jgi:hypothetical protein